MGQGRTDVENSLVGQKVLVSQKGRFAIFTLVFYWVLFDQSPSKDLE
jgi:hypothetical protein